ncbi:Putative alpha-ketoglutarate-dependent sulfonate dioxygenase [Vanrija pseudolonga]|uniref:Alpha-ketoglutarate-dependent sulfonate dioxygenase n=1 Tax=Vanrija pseudolonga TaxID=143232 RepID=A0AAF0YA93_9TREE|nr:Putative alpha-ketoglutarate-dependent sulfonate dioxygenase [Vanrija pseudolonga]
MAPIALTQTTREITEADLAASRAQIEAANVGQKGFTGFGVPPDAALRRYLKAGIDLSSGYPAYPRRPDVAGASVGEAHLRGGKPYVDPGTRADKDKKALFGAASAVRNLTKHIGTEIVGLQLADLTDTQRDELALLVAERGVVFFRDQDLSPHDQLALGKYLGDGAVHRDDSIANVPGFEDSLTVVWETARLYKRSFRNPWPEYDVGRGHGWHVDEIYQPVTLGYTHLYQDTVPDDSGDTLWASGYAAYDLLSPGLKKIVDGLTGIYKSQITYKPADSASGAEVPVLHRAPLVRTHPATGWKTLFTASRGLIGLEGFDKAESDVLIKYLNDVAENSIETQVRFHWTPGTSAIWDNRVVIHTIARDFDGERHGTRVSSLSDKPVFDPASKSRGEALGIAGWTTPAWDVEQFFKSGYSA